MGPTLAQNPMQSAVLQKALARDWSRADAAGWENSSKKMLYSVVLPRATVALRKLCSKDRKKPSSMRRLLETEFIGYNPPQPASHS
jgi:hypothetical protein